MSLSFNQFVKELRDRGIGGHEAYMFTLIYERLGEVEQQLTEAAKVVLAMATAMERFMELDKEMALRLRTLERGGRPDGVEVHSVAWDEGKD